MPTIIPAARSQLYPHATGARRTVAAGLRAEPDCVTDSSPASVPAASASALPTRSVCATASVCATPTAILHPAAKWHNAGRAGAAKLRPTDATATRYDDAGQRATNNYRQ